MNKPEDLDQQAIKLAEAGNYAAARQVWEEALRLDLTSRFRVGVLKNVMGTHMQEKNTLEAIAWGEKALEVIGTSGLDRTQEGRSLHAGLSGHLARLGSPFRTATALAAAWITGASIGAAIGSKLNVHSTDLHGPILTDLRYGGAALGAVVGLGLLRGILLAFPMWFSIIAGVVNSYLVFVTLLEMNHAKGVPILVVVFVLPICIFTFFAANYRSRRRLPIS